MSSRIEQIIGDIESYIENCKPQPLSTTKIIVNKEELLELIDDLRKKTPEEIKRYQKIISNKEAILADARAKADQIIAEAHIQTNELVSEHQIMQQAYAEANEVVMLATKQAQEILDNATNDANSIRMGAMNYTDSQLKRMEDVLTSAIDTSRARYESLLNSLQGFLDVVSNDRAQLMPAEPEPPAKQQPPVKQPTVKQPSVKPMEPEIHKEPEVDVTNIITIATEDAES